MTNLIQILALGSVSIGAYIFASKQLTKFMMNGGKTPKQIIEKHKNDTNKRYLIKYPEADIKTSKHFILALSFIFVFVSSIFAFSVVGEGVKTCILPPLETDGDEIEHIDPFRIQNKQKEEKLEELKKETKKITQISTVPDEVVLPPDIDYGIKTDSTFDTDFSKGEITDDIEPFEPESLPHVVVENMPRFKGCEGITDEKEAGLCTHKSIQTYISNMNIPNYIIDNDLGGKVWMEFVVGKNGQIQDVKILRGANKSLDKIVLKHMKKLPNFAVGGKQNGRKVRVKYNVPVVVIFK